MKKNVAISIFKPSGKWYTNIEGKTTNRDVWDWQNVVKDLKSSLSILEDNDFIIKIHDPVVSATCTRLIINSKRNR